MKFKFLVVLIAFCVTAKADNLRSFGEHDPLNTKAAFCEMAQNHTGTKTEMLYRTAGLFNILNLCRKTPKTVKKVAWDQQILDRIYVEKMEHKENHLQALPTEKRHAWTYLEKTFKEMREAYKGTLTCPVSNFLFIREDEPTTIASSTTILGTTRISVNPKSHTITTYLDRIKSNLDIKNSVKNTAQVIAPVVANPDVPLGNKKVLQDMLDKVHFEARCSEDRVHESKEKIEAALFHELSHPYTADISDHLVEHRLPTESRDIPCIESYCNTLAVLNSPYPLRTARNLSVYHAGHIPALAEALQKEGVTK